MKRMLSSVVVAGGLVISVPPAAAGVALSFDLETLNEVLPALSANEITVPVAGGRTVGVFLENMRVTGLDPAAGEDGTGHILTSMRVRIPQLGIDLPVDPKLSLHVARSSTSSLLELRFEELEVRLPLAGSIDVSSFLPPLRFPAENLWLVAGAEGDVQLRSRLNEIRMGLRSVRFDFDLEALGGK